MTVFRFVPGSRHLDRVVVLRALEGLGDILCAVPAFRALRAALPDAHIAVVARPEPHDVLARFPRYIDEVVPFPGYPGLGGPTDYGTRLPGFVAEMQRRQWDLALQMHGSGIVSNPFLALLCAREMAGLYLPGQWRPDETRFLPYPGDEPEVWRCLRVAALAGAPPVGDHLEFPVTPRDHDELSAALHQTASGPLTPGSYAVVHPGASLPERRWPAPRFSAVVHALVARGLHVVISGTTGEQHLAAEVAARAAGTTTVLAGRTSLGALAALVAGARLVVCNDTGVSHLAAALGTPSVVVFTSSDPARWAPLDPDRHRRVVQPSTERAGPDLGGDVTAARRCLRDACLLEACATERHPTSFVAVEAVLGEIDLVLRRRELTGRA